MYSPAQQGFGRIRANTGLSALGGAPGSQYEMEQRLGSTALSGQSAIDAAKARANAIEYIGKQQGRAAIFGGLMEGIGTIGSAMIGKNAMDKAWNKQRYGSESTKPYPYDQLPPVFPGPVTPPTAPPPVPQSFYGGYGNYGGYGGFGGF
jgi:hypothetical protein|tara:strand:+ start:330 stop:776 length:447 start_codon:yes stop_codon:yes gene_type:complete